MLSFSCTPDIALVAEMQGTGTAGEPEKVRDDLLDFSSGFPTQERFAAIPDKIFKVMRHKAASLKLLHSLMGSIASTNDFAVWSVSCQVFAVVDQPTRLS